MKILDALFQLFIRRAATKGRVATIGALAVVGLIIAFAVRTGEPLTRTTDVTTFINNYGLSVVTPVVCLVFASSVLGDLVDDQTLVYLWLRPIKRSRIVMAAWLAAFAISLPSVVLPLSAAALLAGGNSDVVAGTAAAATLGVIGYSGLFTLLGLRVRRALMWGLAYVLIWEGFVANGGKVASRVALRAYTRSILSDASGIDLKLGTASLPVAIGVPIIVAVVALALASFHLNRRTID